MYRVVYDYEGRDCYSGSMPYQRAKALVDEGHGKAVVYADDHSFQLYPLINPANSGADHVLRATA